MKQQIQQLLEKILEDMGLEEKVSPQVSVPENPAHGDYSTNVAMLLAKQLHKPPVKIAEELKNAIQKYQTTSDAGIVDRVEVAPPGFLNLYVSEATFSNQVSEVLKTGNAYGNSPKTGKISNFQFPISNSGSKSEAKKSKNIDDASLEDLSQISGSENGKKPAGISRKNAAVDYSARQNGTDQKVLSQEFISANKENRLTGDPPMRRKRVMIEFADPNPFKEIHIGHVRNIALGESFCRLLESQGNTVRRVNYEGDVGLHVAKALYGKMHGAPWETAYAAGSKVFEADEQAKKEMAELNKKIYAQDATLAEMYKEGRTWSLNRFEVIYGRLGTHFDRYYFESEVAPVGLALVEKHIEDGIFEKSDGAIVYRGEKVGLHTRVFVTKDHYATYEAKDLALAPLKFGEWPYDLSIIMTGNEQSEYFKVMLAALAQINPDLAAKTRHMPFGMVRLTTGKMSSRTGDVITADWLIGEAKKKVLAILSNNASNYSESEQSDIAEKAAIAAIKYSMLRVNAISDIAFDLEASVSFDGDSGPYLQYTYARCKSVLRKSADVSSPRRRGSSAKEDWIRPREGGDQVGNDNAKERALARQIMQFPDVVAEAAENFAPNTICTYLFHLAQEFNLFYAKNPILGNKTRLDLTAATAQVIKNGLYLLGIETMEKM